MGSKPDIWHPTPEHGLDPAIEFEQLEWLSEKPRHLADLIASDYGQADRERLAREAVDAALKEVRPNPEYADATARTLALDAARYALGLKELPATKEEGES